MGTLNEGLSLPPSFHVPSDLSLSWFHPTSPFRLEDEVVLYALLPSPHMPAMLLVRPSFIVACSRALVSLSLSQRPH